MSTNTNLKSSTISNFIELFDTFLRRPFIYRSWLHERIFSMTASEVNGENALM